MTTSFNTDEYDPALGYHPAVTPLDIRMGITTSATLSSNNVLRCGYTIATGKVAHDFVQILNFLILLLLGGSLVLLNEQNNLVPNTKYVTHMDRIKNYVMIL
jgi:hypothetical protein